MSAYKYTMLIQQSTVNNQNSAIIRVGGWSESWYDTNVSPQPFANLCQARAGLLPVGAAIVGQRIQKVDPSGSAQVFSQTFAGTAALQADVPQMALLCRARATNGLNTRTVILRGIPDAKVEQGEYVATGPFVGKLQAFFDLLKASGWKWRGRNLAADQVPILIVSPVLLSDTKDAIVSLTGPVPGSMAVGEVVQVMGTLDANGIKRGGQFKIKAVDSTDQTLTITQWPYGSCDTGKVRAIETIYPQVSEVELSRIIVRKVGRPFTSYRGRRSKKRRRPTV